MVAVNPHGVVPNHFARVHPPKCVWEGAVERVNLLSRLRGEGTSSILGLEERNFRRSRGPWGRVAADIDGSGAVVRLAGESGVSRAGPGLKTVGAWGSVPVGARVLRPRWPTSRDGRVKRARPRSRPGLSVLAEQGSESCALSGGQNCRARRAVGRAWVKAKISPAICGACLGLSRRSFPDRRSSLG